MESVNIKPTIGRVVWFKDTDRSDQFMPALISYVWDDNMVNLSASSKDGEQFGLTSITLHHGDADDCPNYHCCWMPYQKAQAEKAACEGCDTTEPEKGCEKEPAQAVG